MTSRSVGHGGRAGRFVAVEPPPDLAETHRCVDPAAWEDIYVIGDVHGCLDALERLLDRIQVGPDDLAVFVGDLIRKGPDSKGVLDLVRDHENMVSVRGNNEQGLIEGTKADPALDAADVTYLEELPVIVSFDDVIVVHGGVDHRKPFPAHGLHELLTARSLVGDGYERPLWFERRRELPRVCFGHTVLSEPYATPYAVGLDTGCVYGGALTAYDYRRGRFVSVEPGTAYQHRDADDIVTPRRQYRESD